MGIEVLLGIIASTSLIIATIALFLAAASFTNVLAVQKSTHSVQYVPMDPSIDAANDEYLKDWATPPSAFEKQDKLFKEDLEEQMPEFFEEEKEVYSY